MENRFKVRVFDKTQKKMIYPDSIIQDQYSENCIELVFNHTAEHGKYRSFEQLFKSEVILMQNTGKVFHAGLNHEITEPIWEGDIVLWLDGSQYHSSNIAPVLWCDDFGGFYVQHGEDLALGEFMNEHIIYTVVGNIHEHPEMINEHKKQRSEFEDKAEVQKCLKQ